MPRALGVAHGEARGRVGCLFAVRRGGGCCLCSFCSVCARGGSIILRISFSNAPKRAKRAKTYVDDDDDEGNDDDDE